MNTFLVNRRPITIWIVLIAVVVKPMDSLIEFFSVSVIESFELN